MECSVDLDGKPILSLLRCHRCRNNAAGWQMSLRRGEFIHFCGLWLIMAYHGHDDTHRFGKNMYEERSLHVYSSVVMIHSPYGLQTPFVAMLIVLIAKNQWGIQVINGVSWFP